MKEFVIPSKLETFKVFLFKSRRNKIGSILLVSVIVTEFIVFKYLYPFMNYIHGDSFSYLRAADANATINTYMIGYSKFLRLFSVFFKSDLALAGFQYLLIQFSILFLLLTLLYFFKPGKTVKVVLLTFMILNPLFLHLANLVSSDGLFLALSTIWFALLIWMMFKPSKKIIVWHGVILFLCFTVRYNALIYPFISLTVFIFSKIPLRQKFYGLALAFLMCGVFIGVTTYKYKNLTGYWQYSPFSGWQWANNAMYTYRYVSKSDREPVPRKFFVLDKMIREYFDSTQDTQKYPSEKVMASTFYMWSFGMPLMKYRDSVVFKKDTLAGEFKKWASMGPFYSEYGKYTIAKYPMHFLKYFIWPNANKYYAPPVEFLDNYNAGFDFVLPEAVKWFGYKNETVKIRMKSKYTWILDFYPILTGIINVTMLCCLTCFLLLKGWLHHWEFSKVVLLGASLWLLNAVFTIFASSVALRFQSFPITITIIYVSLFIDWMFGLMAKLQSNERSSIEVKSKKIAPDITIQV
jgi:hypothetical protein